MLRCLKMQDRLQIMYVISFTNGLAQLCCALRKDKKQTLLGLSNFTASFFSPAGGIVRYWESDSPVKVCWKTFLLMLGNGQKLLLDILLSGHGDLTQFTQVFIIMLAVTIHQHSSIVTVSTLYVSLCPSRQCPMCHTP